MYFNIDHEQHSHRAQVQHFTLSSSEYSKLICLSCTKLPPLNNVQLQLVLQDV